MPIDLYATEIAYLSHLTAVWFALPLDERGSVFLRHSIVEAAREGITHAENEPLPRSDRLTMVASYQDSVEARRCGRPVAYLEHGSGQRYISDDERVRDHPSYHGSSGHDGTAVFLAPREEVAARWRARYPEALAVAVGLPKLDFLHRTGRFVPSGPTTVAVSFHSDLALCAETRSALPHYEHGLADVAARLRAEGVVLVGHSHPRLWRRAKVAYERAGVEPIEDFGEVLVRVSVYAIDNSSTLFEAASVGIPVVALNAPWFRRDVHHGLRFWDCVPGLQCDGPEDLAAAIMLALEDPQSVREARERMVGEVYCAVDGKAAERAVAAILTAAARLP